MCRHVFSFFFAVYTFLVSFARSSEAGFVEMFIAPRARINPYSFPIQVHNFDPKGPKHTDARTTRAYQDYCNNTHQR